MKVKIVIVRLLDVDSKIPNLALMKISSYHKKLGDDVDFYIPLFDQNIDLLYVSKIFKFSNEPFYLPNDCKIMYGGTGYDISTKLPREIEMELDLDYSLYPSCDYSIIFTTRGCVRDCKFCLVREKEGFIHDVPICNLNKNGKFIKIFDNNFFASNSWKHRLNILKSYNQPLDFNGGIDLRILTEEMCVELSKCRIKQIHCAFDNYKDKAIVVEKIKLLSKYIKPYKITCYVLVGFETKEINEKDLERIEILRSLKVNPFAMGYIDFKNKYYEKSKSVKEFCRWVNRKELFKTCKFNDYKKIKKETL